MRWSAQFVDPALPILQAMLHRSLYLYPVENSHDQTDLILDKNCGIDYITVTDLDETRHGLCWRCQPDAWDTFTVRKYRVTDAETEFKKRLEAIEKNSIRPHYWAQAYIVDNKIHSLALIQADDLILYIKNNPNVKTRWTGNTQEGKAEFYYVPFKEMAFKGYKMRLYLNDGSKEIKVMNEKEIIKRWSKK